MLKNDLKKVISFFLVIIFASYPIANAGKLSNKLETLANDISAREAGDIKKIDLETTRGITSFGTKNKKLNCLGFPEDLFSRIFEKILGHTTRAKDVVFYFASRENPEYTFVSLRNVSIKRTNFNINRDTYVLTHGFLADGQMKWIQDMKNAILNYVRFVYKLF